MASNVFEIYAKLGLDTSAYDKALDDAMQRAKSASDDIDGLGTGTTKTSGAMSKFGTVVKGGVTGALKIAGAAIGAATTAVVGLGTYAAKTGMEFESQMSKVQAISGATGDELEALEDKAEEMGAITKFSATEAGQAYEYMAMAGWKTADMLGGIEGIMNLAAASCESLATTSDIVTDALTAFGLAAEDSGHFADVLARASSSSNTNVGMMGETFKYVAPLAGAMGFSIEDTAVAIGLMANAGIKAGHAGTSLRAMLANLTEPTEEAGKLMEKLGISMTDMDGNVKSLDTVIGVLRTAFSGLSEAEKVSAASTIAGKEAMSGLLAIVNASDADFATLTAAIADSDGAAQQMATTMQDNLAGALEELGGSAETFGLAMYEGISTPLTRIVTFATDSLNQLTEAYRVGGVEGLTEAAGEILASVITKLTEGLPQMLEIGVNLVVSLLDGLLSNMEQITNGAVMIVETLADGALSLLEKLFDVGWELLLSLVEGIIEALPKLLDTAVKLVVHIATEMTKPESLKRIIEAALNLVKTLANGLIDAIPQLFEAAIQIVMNLIEYLLDPDNIEDLIQTGFEMLAAVAKGVLNGSIEVLKAVANLIADIISKFRNTDWTSLGRGLIDNILGGLKSGWDAVTSWFEDALSGLQEAVQNLWDSIFRAKKAAADVGGSTSHTTGDSTFGGRSGSFGTPTDSAKIDVHVNIDGKEAAEALIDPIDELKKQRGE
jgi:TP901 family phage tail tape measure protein